MAETPRWGGRFRARSAASGSKSTLETPSRKVFVDLLDIKGVLYVAPDIATDQRNNITASGGGAVIGALGGLIGLGGGGIPIAAADRHVPLRCLTGSDPQQGLSLVVVATALPSAPRRCRSRRSGKPANIVNRR